MTQAMRERLIAAAAQKLKAYDFGYDEQREGTGTEIVDAILAELSTPDLSIGLAGRATRDVAILKPDRPGFTAPAQLHEAGAIKVFAAMILAIQNGK